LDNRRIGCDGRVRRCRNPQSVAPTKKRLNIQTEPLPVPLLPLHLPPEFEKLIRGNPILEATVFSRPKHRYP
jgi:hypothetical protein